MVTLLDAGANSATWLVEGASSGAILTQADFAELPRGKLKSMLMDKTYPTPTTDDVWLDMQRDVASAGGVIFETPCSDTEAREFNYTFFELSSGKIVIAAAITVDRMIIRALVSYSADA